MSFSNPKGAVDFYLVIAGIGVFGTTETEPTGSWFSGAFVSADYHSWLYRDISDISEQISYEEGTLRVDSISVKIRNAGGEFSSIYRPTSRHHTYGTQSASSTVATIWAENTVGFATTGAAYAGQERFEYVTAASGVSFNSCTRGTRGTLQEPHFVRSTDPTPTTFKISDYPAALKGRRAVLYSRDADGNEEAIYRGIIGSGVRWGRGYADIPVDHIIGVLEKKIGVGLRQFPMPSQISVIDGSRNSETRIVENSLLATISSTISAKNTSEWEAAYSATFVNMASFRSTGSKLRLTFREDVNAGLDINIAYGSILWANGFSAGDYSWQDSQTVDETAQSEPMRIYSDFSAEGPTIRVSSLSDASEISTGDWVSVIGNPAVQVKSVSGREVTLSQASLNIEGNGLDDFLSFSDDDPLIARQAFRFAQDSLPDAMRRSFGRLSGQVEDLSWCARGIAADDISFGELSTACSSAPPSLRIVDLDVIEATKLEEILTPHLALLGIAPRLTANGAIGFSRIHQPVASEAISILVDENLWALIEAAETESREDAAPILGGVSVKYGRSHVGKESKTKGKEWQGDLTITWREGVDAIGDRRTIGFSVPGLRRSSSRSAIDFDQEINTQIICTHLAIFGMPCAILDVPCAWTSRGIYCGQVVAITHPVAPDVNAGAIGMESKIGIVVGRRLKLTSQGPDMLSILIPESTGGAGIAPSALATAWDVGSKTLTCSTASDGYYGALGDLADFAAMLETEARIPVRLQRYDFTTESTYLDAIVGVDTGSQKVKLSSAPFAALPAGGVWIIFDDWDKSTALSKNYAYCADAATNPTLGTAGDAAKRWVV